MAQIPDLLRSLNIEIWDLFGICVLLFFITETRTLTPETLRFLQHVVRKNGIGA